MERKIVNLLIVLAGAIAVVLGIVLVGLVDPSDAATETVLYSFRNPNNSGTQPYFPLTPVLVGPDGTIYGTTAKGGGGDGGCGKPGCGAIYSLTPPAQTGGTWTENTLYGFNIYGNTASPSALAMGPDGALYGTTSGIGLLGLVFKLAPPTVSGGAWTASFPYSFNAYGLKGLSAFSAPLVGSDGVLYGTAGDGPTLAGGVFALTPPSGLGGAWTKSNLHIFAGAPTDGAFGIINSTPGDQWPPGGLIEQDGTFYGITVAGGATNYGAFYQLTPPSPSNGNAWTEALLYSFSRTGDAWYPIGPLTPGDNGTLYGVAAGSPSGLNGSIFALTPPSAPGNDWTEAAVHIFAGGSDGLVPNAGLVMLNGTLYGTTSQGGTGTICAPGFSTQGCGTVFSLTPPASPGDQWAESIVYSFTGLHGDGGIPTAGLAAGPNGVLYGTTFWGGTGGIGTVYQITP